MWLIASTLLTSVALSTASPSRSSPGALLLRSSGSTAPLAPAPAPSCATFHARLGTRPDPTDIYYLTSECVASVPASLDLIPLDWNAGRLMWLAPSSLDAELLQQRLASMSELLYTRQLAQHEQQTVLDSISTSSEDDVKLVVELGAHQGRLVQFARDDLLREWTEDPIHALDELVYISADPLPRPSFSRTQGVDGPVQGGELVSARDRQRVIDHITHLKFSPLISSLLKTFHKKDIIADVRYLSAEDQSSASTKAERWVSRHSMSEGASRASDWLLQRFRMYGFLCKQHVYKNEFAPMIECSLPGIGNVPRKHANETIVIGGHFDSRGSFGYPAAPGADDDGSGTALLLALARHIYVHRLTFSRKIIIAAFSGEEQGLLGSNYFAKTLKDRHEDVVLMVQVDMIAYTVPGEPIQMARPDKIGLPEAAYLIGNVTEIYVPELQVGYTPACCSDHQSFEQVGYASTWVFERNGPIKDPCYHNSCDLSSRPGYNFEQVHATARAVLATLLEVGGFSFV